MFNTDSNKVYIYHLRNYCNACFEKILHINSATKLIHLWSFMQKFPKQFH